MMMKCDDDHYLKRWPNGLESSRKLKTWVYFRLRLATERKSAQVLVTSICNTNLLAIEILDISTLRCFFLDLRSLARKLAIRLATNRSFYESSTCGYSLATTYESV